MSIINESYFINDIAIPNTNNETVEAGLNASITKREKESLLSILGYELYELFIANPTVQIYKDILDGKEFSFEFCGKPIKRKWVGLANTEKISLIAFYTYLYYEKDRNEFNSGIGHVKPKAESAVQENPRLKFVNAWDQYLFQRGDLSKVNKCSKRLRSSIRSRSDTSYFDKFDLNTYEFLNDDPSLFNFMLANVSDYPTWEFTQPESGVNVFDL